jgi:AcrR family transcriptional regulator
MARPDTKERILDAAQKLFADKGFNGASLRAVTREAGVNLAAVHYHFGSKEELVQAVLDRVLAPLNRERLALLDRFESEAGENSPPLEAVAEAFVGPTIRMSRRPEGAIAMQLLGRVFGDPSGEVARIFKEQFHEVAKRFGAAFRSAAPHLAPDETFWRLSFSAGAMAHTMAIRGEQDIIEEFTEGACRPEGPEETIRRLVRFISGAFRAEGPAGEEGGRP